MTEIEKLIEKLQKEAEGYKMGGDPKGNAIQSGILKAILISRESLPAERQAIEEAYRAGFAEGVDKGIGNTVAYKHASDYFNKTYNK